MMTFAGYVCGHCHGHSALFKVTENNIICAFERECWHRYWKRVDADTSAVVRVNY